MPATTTKTFRGRSLEELLPRVRAELGPEAVVLARRDGLEGGVGGFFQRGFVEVDAEGEPPEPTTRDTAGLYRMIKEASAFAKELEVAQQTPAAGLYGPQPTPPETPAAFVPMPTPEPAAHQPIPVPEPQPDPRPAQQPGTEPLHEAAPSPDGGIVAVAHEPATLVDVAPRAAVAPPVAATPVAAAAPAPIPAAETLVTVLTDAGLPHGFAAEVVDDATTHGLAFGSPRQLKTLVRAALAARIPVMAPIRGGARTVVVAGGSGAGKTTAARRLAAAYRDAGRVAVRELPLGDSALRDDFDGLTVIDAPATRVRDAAGIKALAKQLAGLGAEVHLAVPATLSGPAVADLVAALAPLQPSHVLLTHADETIAPGAAIARAALAGLPLSYVSGDDDLRPAVAAELAKRLV